MVREILIVNADRQTYLQIEKTCKQTCGDSYSMTFAKNTKAAADRLREHSIALVLLGYLPEKESTIAFLFYIWNAFPDIPVLNLSGEQEFPESLMIEEKGIAVSSSKSLPLNKWPSAIDKALKREQEGGYIFISDVSNFVQMIQNELRTCTLRILDHTESRLGILFFEKGELKNARLKTVQGEIAAYALLSWENVKISVQDSCDISMIKIRSNLQALLIESQVKKDHQEKPYSSSAWIDAAQEEKQNYQKLISHIPTPRISEKETEPTESIETEGIPVLPTPPESSGITKILHRPMTTGAAVVLVLFLIAAYLLSPYMKDPLVNRSSPSKQTINQPAADTEKTSPSDISTPKPTKKETSLLSKSPKASVDAGQSKKDTPESISSIKELIPLKEELSSEVGTDIPEQTKKQNNLLSKAPEVSADAGQSKKDTPESISSIKELMPLKEELSPEVGTDIPEQTKKQNNLLSKAPEVSADAGQSKKDTPESVSSTKEVLPEKVKLALEVAPDPRLFTVYLHYAHPENRHLAYQLADHLMSGNFVVPKIDLVKYTGNDIRYFHAADQDLATDLKMQVVNYLKDFHPHKDNVKFKMKNLAKIYPLVPQGQLEIWLSLPTD